MTDQDGITHVADTALWVAALRAAESSRSDAVFHDELAELLAGERGRAIARDFPQGRLVGWSVVVRTSAIDLLIQETLQTGIDTVINFGAGMDSRPYRMTLPTHLRWVELDFPHLIAAKTALLGTRTAKCRVERIGMDLRDRSARRETLARLGAGSGRTLLIAEGVVPYLSNDDLRELAKDCREIPEFVHWILDFDNAGARKLPASWAERLRAAPFLLEVADWFRFFHDCGWRAQRVIGTAEESERLRRPYPLVIPAGLLMRVLPRAMRRKILDASGAVLLAPR